MNRRITLSLAMMMLAGVLALQAQDRSNPPATIAAPKVLLVELFTSEGCSSCPPADALLRQVDGTHTQAGLLIVGISEHVTYWNALGWSDPFSSPTNTQRQNEYGERFHLESVYTPQMVVNGTEQVVGSDRAALAAAIKKEEQLPARMSLQILSLNVVGDSIRLRYSAGGELPSHGADLIAVVVDDEDQSHVLRGENSGAMLTHVSVARSLSRVARVQTPGEGTAQIKLPPAFQSTQKHHLILFAQLSGNGRVLGADTKPL